MNIASPSLAIDVGVFNYNVVSNPRGGSMKAIAKLFQVYYTYQYKTSKKQKAVFIMSERPIEGLMGTTLDKIRDMVDVNTIIGSPITVPGGTTVIPVSKVMYGFASGGSEFNNKNESKDNLFGGGAGAGVTITPIAFIAVTKDDVKLLNVTNFKDSQDRAVGLVPELLDKIIGLFKKDKSDDKNNDSSEEKNNDAENAETGIDDPKV